MRGQLAFNLDPDAQARDRALDLLETHRQELVALAQAVALEICRERGRVTSPEVLTALKERGFGESLEAVDRRFMGAVFREGSGWRRIGWEAKGSHKRPVSVWVRKGVSK